ncbi:MAG: polysaccharide deacetylase family protein [bacterium]
MKPARSRFILYLAGLVLVVAGFMALSGKSDCSRHSTSKAGAPSTYHSRGPSDSLAPRFLPAIESHLDELEKELERMKQERPAFGSAKLLHACWSAEELRGTSADKEIIPNVRNPFRGPPSREKPKEALPPLTPDLRGSVRSVRPKDSEKVAALTFDLCERTGHRTGYDAAIVNYLRREKIKATFFAGGKWMHSHPDKTRQLMADPLFELGNHTWTHGNLRLIKGEAMREQVLWTQAQYELLREDLARSKCAKDMPGEMEKIPEAMRVFRFPYGTCSQEALEFLAGIGLPAIQWDVVTGDPDPGCRPEDIVDEVMRNIKPGSIIIMHANGYGHGTAQALPLFVPELREKGYTFLTVSELLKTGPANSRDTCFKLEPGDNKAVDRIYGRGT